eukprot:PITA_31064
MQYIITATEYLTRWAEEQLVKDCSTTTTTKFLLEYVLTRFGCPKILMSDRGTHFLNETIVAMLEKFQVCNTQRNNWDVRIPMVLWAFRMTCNKLTGQTLFMLVYGIEAMMPMEYIVLSLRIATLTDMEDRKTMEEHLAQFLELEEDRFLAGFYQQVQKEHEKAWHDQHIKLHTCWTPNPLRVGVEAE